MMPLLVIRVFLDLVKVSMVAVFSRLEMVVQLYGLDTKVIQKHHISLVLIGVKILIFGYLVVAYYMLKVLLLMAIVNLVVVLMLMMFLW
jgi:hypothetical protein